MGLISYNVHTLSSTETKHGCAVIRTRSGGWEARTLPLCLALVMGYVFQCFKSAEKLKPSSSFWRSHGQQSFDRARIETDRSGSCHDDHLRRRRRRRRRRCRRRRYQNLSPVSNKTTTIYFSCADCCSLQIASHDFSNYKLPEQHFCTWSFITAEIYGASSRFHALGNSILLAITG